MSIYDGHDGIKEDQYGVRAYVAIGSGDEKRQKSKRFARGTPLKTITNWQETTRVALRAGTVVVKKDTLRNDAKRYLEHQKAPGPDGKIPAGYGALCCEINAWMEDLGDLPRHEITRDLILDIRHRWLTKPRGGPGTTDRVTKPIAAKTVNHRVRALRALYHYIDGKSTTAPWDDFEKLREPAADPKFVDVKVIRNVAKQLRDEPQTLARFMVLASTGQRPAQLKRALPEDVDLVRGFWKVRPAKGGNPIPVVLTDDMTVAFKMFIEANAWGHFDGSDYAKSLYDSGWPRHIRPYNAKHTLAIALGEAGADLQEIADWLGHKQGQTTTKIYTGHILAVTRKSAKRLEGRIGWKKAVAAPRAPRLVRTAKRA